MSLFTALLPVVGGLFGKSKEPDAPAPPPAPQLSDFQSSLQDPIQSLYVQQALQGLGYNARKTGGDVNYTGIGQYGAKGLYTPIGKYTDQYLKSLNGGPNGLNQAQYDQFVKDYGQGTAEKLFAKNTTPTSWEFTQAGEPEAYKQIRENFNRELAAQSNKVMGSMASRGLIDSGANAEMQRKMAGDTGNAISNAIEQNKQQALARLNDMLQAERDQQFRAAQIAAKTTNDQFGNQNTQYGNQLASRQRGIDELSTMLGGLGKVRIGGKSLFGA